MERYHNIVVLTGAGLSVASGLGTFRGPGGLWENFRIEDVATPEGFARDPVLVHTISAAPGTKRRGPTPPISPLPGSSASTAMC